MQARVVEVAKVGPSFVEVETRFEPDSMIAAEVVAIEMVAAVPTTAAANSGSRAEVVVIALAKAAGIVETAPMLVVAEFDPAPIAAEGNLAVPKTPVLAPSSTAAIESGPMLAPVGPMAASRNSVEKAGSLKLTPMLHELHVLYARCAYDARCRVLPIVQAEPG